MAISAGSVPLSAFSNKRNACRFVNSPSCDGTVPCTSQKATANDVSAVKRPICDGRVPETLRLRMAKLITESTAPSQTATKLGTVSLNGRHEPVGVKVTQAEFNAIEKHADAPVAFMMVPSVRASEASEHQTPPIVQAAMTKTFILGPSTA